VRHCACDSGCKRRPLWAMAAAREPLQQGSALAHGVTRLVGT
jgi:hypothetical protein